MRVARCTALGLLALAASLLTSFGGMPQTLARTPGKAWFGRFILPHYRIVSYYGNPLSPYMGILGEYAPQVMLQKLAAQALAYQRADPSHPVLKALEMVAVVAQRSAGPDGSYSARMPLSLIDQELQLARSAHAILILDVQVGRASVPSEVRYLAPILRQPDVELALDPEFDMLPGNIPGIEFGTMSTADINWTIQYLNRMVVRDHLPQKVLIVHQFIESMVPGWRGIVEAPYVALVRDMDGFGGQSIKMQKYEIFIHDEAVPYVLPSPYLPTGLRAAVPLNAGTIAMYSGRPVVIGGLKLFYTQDTPVMTPEMLMTLNPPPLVVIYQ